MSLLKKIKKIIRPQLQAPVMNLAEALAGDNVECICCGNRFITFLPFGLVKRANAQCPACGSLERHRLHWHYMVNQTNLLRNEAILKVLHVAPEEVLYNRFIGNPGIEYIPCAKMGEGYPDVYPAGTIDIDITDIHFGDHRFDVIYCSHVLEHIPDDHRAMQELLRILKPGGWALLQVPVDINRASTYEDFSITGAREREQAFGQSDHVRVYGRDYKQRLEKAGFRVKQERYTDQFSENEIFRYGFQKGEDIYVCTGPY